QPRAHGFWQVRHLVERPRTVAMHPMVELLGAIALKAAALQQRRHVGHGHPAQARAGVDGCGGWGRGGEGVVRHGGRLIGGGWRPRKPGKGKRGPTRISSELAGLGPDAPATLDRAWASPASFPVLGVAAVPAVPVSSWRHLLL